MKVKKLLMSTMVDLGISEKEIADALSAPEWDDRYGWTAYIPHDLRNLWPRLSSQTKLTALAIAHDIDERTKWMQDI